jgi:hypothetical protein
MDGKIWNVWHKTEQGGGLSSVAYAPTRYNRRVQIPFQENAINCKSQFQSKIVIIFFLFFFIFK